ncbi:hypothetical protein I862_01630 [endosymbiont of Acanthamoeba sp. UWC8]|uniref:hypothetical protein n=1 Tax=endosymbiont of Acanthamoeba sp. UWC8 TaxID=86106 RepID=UPI0004D1D477|nr:hypothetical protein [endosymbiont of Acanthamoeba sp. UWC8]AIF80889.1 hypothetical protein I862_01630 [endosymbiont of Acanthamoeba sp. UWC8]
MSNLEQVKERLKSALNKVNNKIIDAQKAIQSQHQLETENNELKAAMALLQKEISELKHKIRSIGIEQEQKSLSKQAEISAPEIKAPGSRVRKSIDGNKTDESEEINSKVSLNELKGLVGNKKWE